MSRAIFAVVPIVVILGMTALGAPQSKETKVLGRPRAIESIRPALVQIQATVSNTGQEVKQFTGTGMFVNSEAYVLTAHHVVAPEPAGTTVLGVGLPMETLEGGGIDVFGNFVVVVAAVVAVDRDNDLAVIKLAGNLFKGEVRIPGIVIGAREPKLAPLGEVRFDLSRAADGIEIALSGFPFGYPVLVTNGGWVGSSRAFVQKPTPPGTLPSFYRGAFVADLTASRGNSGGPVYIRVADGRVLGVLVSGHQGVATVIPSKYATDLLDKHRLAWQK